MVKTTVKIKAHLAARLRTHRDPAQMSARRKERSEPHIAWEVFKQGNLQTPNLPCSLAATPKMMFKMYQLLLWVLHLSRRNGPVFKIRKEKKRKKKKKAFPF